MENNAIEMAILHVAEMAVIRRKRLPETHHYLI
jgi:hypothetical protein